MKQAAEERKGGGHQSSRQKQGGGKGRGSRMKIVREIENRRKPGAEGKGEDNRK